ncbi:MAG: ACT domain-containing protein [Spirochaetaceae bacterium]|jgi:ACT domain-containing protein|nr:ACT domain-containing protein [Spirochaetaceae bacterium]
MQKLPEKNSNNAIISVIGSDHVGIIAKICSFLAERDINIEDVSQTILSGNFVMLMMVDLSKNKGRLEELKQDLNEIGKSMNVSISMMHERVFSEMHRI